MPVANETPRGDRPVRMNRGLRCSVHVRCWISDARNDPRVQFCQEGEAGLFRRPRDKRVFEQSEIAGKCSSSSFVGLGAEIRPDDDAQQVAQLCCPLLAQRPFELGLCYGPSIEAGLEAC